jgi:hypothetical protein
LRRRAEERPEQALTLAICKAQDWLSFPGGIIDLASVWTDRMDVHGSGFRRGAIDDQATPGLAVHCLIQGRGVAGFAHCPGLTEVIDTQVVDVDGVMAESVIEFEDIGAAHCRILSGG